MKTNMGDLIDTANEIKDLLIDIDKRLDNIETRLDRLEISQPCECLIDVDMDKINDLVWEVQELLRSKK